VIADVVERDLRFYDPSISEAAVTGLNRFAQSIGLLKGTVPYDEVVATQFRHLWAG
jgi:NitT/TauT family transport system substrate-binding protein